MNNRATCRARKRVTGRLEGHPPVAMVMNSTLKVRWGAALGHFTILPSMPSPLSLITLLAHALQYSGTDKYLRCEAM